MCIGIPMQIVECGKGYACCEGFGQRKQINTLLVGDQPVGTWLLTFLDSAREVLNADDAARITNAVQAVNLIMQGETNIEHLFADLIDREPQLPESAAVKMNEQLSGED